MNTVFLAALIEEGYAGRRAGATYEFTPKIRAGAEASQAASSWTFSFRVKISPSLMLLSAAGGGAQPSRAGFFIAGDQLNSAPDRRNADQKRSLV